MNMMSGEVFFASFHRVAVGFNCYYAEFGILNSELSKLTIKKDVPKNVSVSFDNCIESNRGCLWGNQMSPVTHKTKKKS